MSDAGFAQASSGAAGGPLAAAIDPTAEIGQGCRLGHGVVIEAGVRLGPGCSIGHHVVVHAGTLLGSGCRVEDHAVLGRRPRPGPTSTVTVPADLPPLAIGEHTSVGTGAVVYRGSVVGHHCLIGDLAFLREGCQVGDFVVVGTHVTVEIGVRIGRHTKIQTGAYIAGWTTIEEHCFIAPRVVTANDNYMGRTEERFRQRGGPLIRRGARVGANATLLPNVEVGAEAFVAAGSVVTRDVPPGQLVMGSPARIVRAVPPEELLDPGPSRYPDTPTP
jgi:acetyltransferase-like isoleucine patch superfamily enzyme